MRYEESSTLELKSCATRTFLKTVSAFANYGAGHILFGVKDDGSIAGIENAQQVAHDVENAINDSIKPLPRYILTILTRNGLDIIDLEVFEGMDKPYFYRSKAYRRSNTSTIEVDRTELNRLVLEGQNLSFEEVSSKSQHLEFNALSSELKTSLGIKALNKDILKTLQLYADGTGYNNAAAVISDKNGFSGVDIVRFGRTEDEIFERREISGVSALAQLQGAMDMFSQYYQPERIEGMHRKLVDLVPEEAFREAVANALVHRLWDSAASVRIALLPDRIQVTSPGGLPSGITEAEYKDGRVSILRNPIIGNVFFRLGHIERFGTGVRRIKRLYEGTASSPSFDVSANAISVTLPVVEDAGTVSHDEEAVLATLDANRLKGRADIQSETGLSKDKTVRLLNSLAKKGLVETEGRGRSTVYRRFR